LAQALLKQRAQLGIVLVVNTSGTRKPTQANEDYQRG